ncbi:MAG: hypothetical protein WKG06_16170 [Segetibacter sp.]
MVNIQFIQLDLLPIQIENIPAHIHTSIKEPNIDNEYYIDEFIFDDDKLLTSAKRKALENRGGSGILRVLISGDLQIAEHNIILGLNIPNYPDKKYQKFNQDLKLEKTTLPSRLTMLSDQIKEQGLVRFVNMDAITELYFLWADNPSWNDIKKWLSFLEQESKNRSKYMKAYFVYGNEKNYNKQAREKELETIGTELNLKNIALTFVPSMTDTESEVNLNKINPTVENTFIIFRQSAIIAKFIDLKATAENFALIANTLDKTKGDYFNLSAPPHD